MPPDFRSPSLPGLRTSNQQPHSRVPPAWPVLLDLEQACAYLGVSPATFRKICPVPAVALGAAVTRWNRNQIDEWVNSLPPKTTARAVSAQLPATPYDVAMEASEARREASLKKIRERTNARFER